MLYIEVMLRMLLLCCVSSGWVSWLVSMVVFRLRCSICLKVVRLYFLWLWLMLVLFISIFRCGSVLNSCCRCWLLVMFSFFW